MRFRWLSLTCFFALTSSQVIGVKFDTFKEKVLKDAEIFVERIKKNELKAHNTMCGEDELLQYRCTAENLLLLFSSDNDKKQTAVKEIEEHQRKIQGWNKINAQPMLEYLDKEIFILKESKNGVSNEMRKRLLSFYLEKADIPVIAQLIPEGGMYTKIAGQLCDRKEERLETFLSIEDLTLDELNHTMVNDSFFLVDLAGTGPESTINLAIQRGCDPNIKETGRFGNTPLTWSIANDSKKEAIALINACQQYNRKIDLDEPSTFNGNTALILCIAKGHAKSGEMSNYELTRFLLEKGANPNKPDINGYTPLHYAFLRRDQKTIELLLKHHANLNAIKEGEGTPVDMLEKDIRVCEKIVFQATNADKDPQGCCSFPYYTIFFENTRELQAQYKK